MIGRFQFDMGKIKIFSNQYIDAKEQFLYPIKKVSNQEINLKAIQNVEKWIKNYIPDENFKKFWKQFPFLCSQFTEIQEIDKAIQIKIITGKVGCFVLLCDDYFDLNDKEVDPNQIHENLSKVINSDQRVIIQNDNELNVILNMIFDIKQDIIAFGMDETPFMKAFLKQFQYLLFESSLKINQKVVQMPNMIYETIKAYGGGMILMLEIQNLFYKIQSDENCPINKMISQLIGTCCVLHNDVFSLKQNINPNDPFNSIILNSKKQQITLQQSFDKVILDHNQIVFKLIELENIFQNTTNNSKALDHLKFLQCSTIFLHDSFYWHYQYGVNNRYSDLEIFQYWKIENEI